MTVRIEKKGKVWTVIHSRAEARNAMAHEIARFPQGCLRADRRSVYLHFSDI